MLSRDPLGGSLPAPSSQNRYAYALDNPWTYVDPSGMSTIQSTGAGLPGSTSTRVTGGLALESLGSRSRAGGCVNPLRRAIVR